MLVDPLRIGRDMLDKACPDAAQVGVIRGIEQFRRHRAAQLKMTAFAAAHHVKLICIRLFRLPVAYLKIVAQRDLTKVNEARQI